MRCEAVHWIHVIQGRHHLGAVGVRARSQSDRVTGTSRDPGLRWPGNKLASSETGITLI
jgi:hypothetical protein